jgi:hypothetical protein
VASDDDAEEVPVRIHTSLDQPCLMRSRTNLWSASLAVPPFPKSVLGLK